MLILLLFSAVSADLTNLVPIRAQPLYRCPFFIMFIIIIIMSWNMFLIVDWHPYLISMTDVFQSHNSLNWCAFGFKDSHQGPGIQWWLSYMNRNPKSIHVYARESKVDSCKWLWILCWFQYRNRNSKSIHVYARESKVDSHEGLWIYVDSHIGQGILSQFPYRDGNPVIFYHPLTA